MQNSNSNPRSKTSVYDRLDNCNAKTKARSLSERQARAQALLNVNADVLRLQPFIDLAEHRC